MKTIAQLAEELNVTKPAIRRYLTNEVREKFTETVSRVIYISEQGENFIKSKIRRNKLEAHAETVSTLISTLQKELETKNLQLAVKDEQLKAKDEQMKVKDKQIADLTATIKIQAENFKHKPPKKVYTRKKQIVAEPKSPPIKRLIQYRK